MDVSCIGGPLHGTTHAMPSSRSFRHVTWGEDGERVHLYSLEKYVNQHRSAFFLVHPDATDAQIDHALGLADI